MAGSVDNNDNRGVLYLVSTPIGNLEDITLRAIRVLKEADLIAAEDTRRSGVLLKHFGIKNRLESYHDFNKKKKTPVLIEYLRNGKSIAVITDAGTPGISDPAFYLVRESAAEGIKIVPVPGPTAAIAALVASGLPTDRFVFEGFLPAKKNRRKRLESLRDEPRTIIFYESPHRLIRTLEDLLAVLGDRPMVIGRELTKKFEELVRGRISTVLENFSQRNIKGEFVLVVRGYFKKENMVIYY